MLFGILWIFSLTFFSCFCLLGLRWDLKELSSSPISQTINLSSNQCPFAHLILALNRDIVTVVQAQRCAYGGSMKHVPSDLAKGWPGSTEKHKELRPPGVLLHPLLYADLFPASCSFLQHLQHFLPSQDEQKSF